MAYQIPINYYQGNLAFGKMCAWSYYKVPGVYYDFLSEEKKIQRMLVQSIAFMGIKTELHMLVIPVKQEIAKVSMQYEKQITGKLKELGISHLGQITEELERKYGSSHRPEFFIGVKMMPYEPGEFVEQLKNAWKEFKKRIYETSGMYTVTESELRQYKRSEEQIYQRLFRYLKAERITEDEMQFLIRRNFERGEKVEIIKGMKPDYQMREGKRLIEGTDMKRLTEGLIDDTPLDYIKLVKHGRTTYMAFLTVSYFVHESEAVGNEFIYQIQQFDFPVELSIRAKIKDNETSKKIVKGKKDGLDGEIKFAEESGKTPPQEVMEGQEQLENLEYDLKKTRKPLIEMSAVFCVCADSLEQIRIRTSLLKEIYKGNFEMVLEQPHGDQFMLFNEYIPGAEMQVTDYIHVVEPNFLASGMFGATKELGDPYGFFIGTTGVNHRLVYFNPRLAAQGLRGTITNSPSITIIGDTGTGKSVLVNDLIYNTGVAGGKVLLLDPKGERTSWLESFPELGQELNIVTLFSDEEYRGLLDPWYIMENEKEAEALAISILTVILGGLNRDSRFKIITKAVKTISSQPDPCMTAVMDYLLESKDQKSIDVGEDIQAFYDISFSVLVFGNGRPEKTINLESAINILQIQNLALPEEKVNPKDYTLENVLSVALLTPITAFAEKFVHSDRTIFKIFVSEEAWATMASAQGKQVSNKLTREGRALNGGIYFVSQNVGILDSAIRSNIGVKFAFRCSNDDEARDSLEFLNMEYTEENAEILKSLDNGQCLMQDSCGRVGIVNVDPVFQDLMDGWSTTPPMEVEE